MVYDYCITEIDRRRGRCKRDSHRVFSTYDEALRSLNGYAAEHCTYYDDDSEEKPDGYYLPGWYDDASGEFCLEKDSDCYTYDCGLLTLKINENLVTEEAYDTVMRTIRDEDSTLHDVCFSLNTFFSEFKDGIEAAKDLEFYRVHHALTPNYAENEIYVEYIEEEGIVFRLKYRKSAFNVEFYVSEEDVNIDRYIVRDVATGTQIECFDSLAEAREEIERYEEEDRQNGEYSEDYYEIYDDREKRVIN